MDSRDNLKLIAAFKKHPVIYDRESVGYNDRKKKAAAWKSVASEIDAHPEACRRRIFAMLSTHRAEKAKILKGRASVDPADKYEPKWRYWNAFKFYRGLKDDEEDPLGRAPDDMPPPKRVLPRSTANLAAKKNKNPENADNRQDDELAAMGKMVDVKLKKMDPKQRAFAEMIIDQILYKGLLFRLDAKSEIGETDATAPEWTMPETFDVFDKVAPKRSFDSDDSKEPTILQSLLESEFAGSDYLTNYAKKNRGDD